MRNSPPPQPRRVIIDDDTPFTFAEGPVWCERRVYPDEFGFLMIDIEGTRLWRSATGRGDWTWCDPMNLPDALKAA